MAYQTVDPIALTPTVVAAGSYTVTLSSLGLTLVNDDWLIVGVICSVTSGTLSTASTGWTEIGELDVTSGQRMALYKCKVAGGTAADLTVSMSAGTGIWQAFLSLWRDADATDPTDTVSNSVGTNATSEVTATMTPVTDNCTVMYFSTGRSGAGIVALRLNAAEVVGEITQASDDTSAFTAMAVGTVQQTTKAATAKTVYANGTTRIGTMTLAIKNKTSGALSRDCRAGITKAAWMGSFGVSHEALGTVFGAPSTFVAWAGGTINGVTADTTAPVIDNTLTGSPPLWGTYTSVASAANTASAWVGGWIALPATVDFTGKLLSLEWLCTLLGAQFGAQGVAFALGDSAAASTGNAVVFQLAPKLLIQLNKVNTSVIAPATAVSIQTTGTINLATVNKIGLFYHRAGSSVTTRAVLFRNVLALANSIMVGGGSVRPLHVGYLNAVLNGWGYSGLCDKQGDAIMVKSSVQFGDGATATYVDTTGTMLNMPEAYSTVTQPFVNVPANTLTVGVYAASGDTMTLAAATMAAGAKQNLTFNASTSASATYSTNGLTIKRFLPTMATNAPVVGGVFSYCDEVAFKGADVTSVTISNTTSADAACSWDANGGSMTSSTIDVTGTSALYHIELGAAVTETTLASVTFSGTPVTDKVHVLNVGGTVAAGAFVVGSHYEIKTVGTTNFTLIGASANTIGIRFTATGVGTGTGTADIAVKITTSGTTSLVDADVTSAGAKPWVAAPAVYQVAIASSFTAGSRIQIYDTTSSTELFNGTASAGNTVLSGTTATWTDPLPASASRAIRVRVAYNPGTTAKMWQQNTGLTCGTTSGTASVTYPITQVDDTTYNSNGIDGPAIYPTSGITFTDATTDLVNCNITGGTVSWKTIYACFVYWLSTAAGIDDDVTYIDAPDTANYLLTAMKIRNTSATPLAITGGYGRSATTGLVADIVDTAGSTGNIFPSPDHVVAYATGSGVTAQNITDIAAASATSTIAIAVDGATTLAESLRLSNAVLGGKVSGAGAGTETFRNLANTKDRMIFTVDSSGNRTAVVRDLT